MKSLAASTRLALIVIFGLFEINSAGFTNVYPRMKDHPLKADENAGDPLFLTPLIETGKIDDARKLATVQHKEMNDVSSYAGYLTVNKEDNSNMFFWFFPAQVRDIHNEIPSKHKNTFFFLMNTKFKIFFYHEFMLHDLNMKR